MNTLLSSPSHGTSSITGSVARHSHFYDAALHRAITETGAPGGREVLARAAASAAFRAGVSESSDFALEELIATCGLGIVSTSELSPDRGRLTIEPSAYVRARLEMFGTSGAPACDITRGVIAGGLGAKFGGSWKVQEVECVAAGGKRCRFEAAPQGSGEDGAEEFELSPIGPRESPGTTSAIVLDLVEGDEGQPAGYGRLWAELYARAAFDFEREIPETMGAKFSNLASVVLTEAAHLGTFYSIGHLIRSTGWQDRIVPLLPNREDWPGLLVDVAGHFGWGTWEINSLLPGERVNIHLRDGYEARSFHSYSAVPAPGPRCYFAKGFVAALMNVLFAGDILEPKKLNQTVYNSLFRSPASYRAVETRCSACGDPFCEFIATPLSPTVLRF